MCLWDKTPTAVYTASLVLIIFTYYYLHDIIYLYTHPHLFPEVDSPGNICVGVILFPAAPVQLCLDAFRFHWKISGH